ncbi:flap endonuclease GEN-like 1-like [Dorcoceras hygrometricum]|uniref:Flap endonuclease GEN-like 1 n=1 Tax=Dorcoceras hygrometricum TaxID=472368 RepID=A0A2Z7C562_9LAMI|nr:flap endonuclease GEN-like 1-like [Dorcoceras hygrometricum]
MGVGGNFWDLLKPYALFEGFDFLRNKRVAVDLSYWIVQHETAVKGYVRNPHIRLTFFRTINLFAKFGAYPVFVLDGIPSPLKYRARIARYFRASGVDLSSKPEAEEGVSVERNWAFRKCVEECVALLELLGMPVLRATGEAEALCAQLNSEGHVDACITADSDALLYGAQCVIKRFQPNSKEPFECYHVADIEAGLELKRKHLIAVSLLVGSDHDIGGVQGIGLDTALRFVKCFSEEEILDRLNEIAKGDSLLLQENIKSGGELARSSIENSPKPKFPHCSRCGHPGNRRAHLKVSCNYCSSIAGKSCWQKSRRKEKENKKIEAWRFNVCRKIASERDFPINEIIHMYLSKKDGSDDYRSIRWASPQTELLVDYLTYMQNWEPSYIKKMLLPMLSTLYLRDVASGVTIKSLYEQYEFHSIQRIKVRYGHEFFVVNWKKAVNTLGAAPLKLLEGSDVPQEEESREVDESIDFLEELDVPNIRLQDGCCFLSTDEDIELVQNAFPEKATKFFEEKKLKEMKSRKKKCTSGSEATDNSESPSSRSVQLSITEFYCSSKIICQNKNEEKTRSGRGSAKDKRKEPGSGYSGYSKSVRRRLLFG